MIPFTGTPTLPTDNLYKFMTVLGLVIAASCAHFAYSMERTKEERVLSTILKQIELHQEFAAAIKHAETSYPALVTELQRRQDQSGMLLTLVKDIGMAEKDKVFSIAVFKWGAAAGVAIFACGLVLWYLLFQRHMDRLILRGKIKV